MISSNWKEYITRHQDFILIVIFILVLLVPGLVFTYKYVSENSPQTRQPLVILLNSLSVSNFSTNPSDLRAKWVAEMTFLNRDKDFEIYINPFHTFVHYKERYAVSCASIEPIQLKQRRQKRVLVEFNGTDCWGKQKQPFDLGLGKKILKELWEEKAKGAMHVSLDMHMDHGEYHKGVDRWDLSLNPSCSNIRLDFMDTTVGRFFGHDLHCHIDW